MWKGPRSFAKRLLDQVELTGTLPVGSAAVFAGFVVADPLLLTWVGPGRELSQWYVAGLVLIAVTTVIGVLVRPSSSGWVIGMCMINLMALGLMRTVPESMIEVCFALPALYLANRFAMSGTVIASVAVVPAVLLPTWLIAEHPPGDAVSVVMSILLVVAVSLHVGVGEEVRRTVRAKLIDARRLQEGILNSVEVGLAVVGRDGAWKALNPRQLELGALAYPRGSIGRVGQHGFIYAEDGVSALDPDQMPSARAFRGEEFAGVLIWVGEDPETRRALHSSSRVLRNAQGKFESAVVAYADVTTLLDAIRVRDDFVNSVSHELRTPLTSILGYAEVACDDDATPEVMRSSLKRVQRNADRLNRLVGDLLDTNQQQNGLALVTGRVDLSSVVALSVTYADEATSAADLDLVVERNDPIWVEADALRLEQVLTNLISNAVKYTPAGGRVAISLTRTDDQAVLTVADTGVGIAAEDLQAVFNRFYRARNVQEGHIAGVGLGLAIVHQIVTAHGGDIDVESAVGIGSTFRVRLPLAEPTD